MKLRGKAILGAAGVAVLLAVIATLTLLFVPAFQVAKVSVEGNVHTAAEDIDAASGVVKGAPLVRVNTQQAAQNIATMPWVSKVNVDRSFPDTVKVTVQERRATLFANRADGPHLFDDTGRPFVIEQPPIGTVEVTGTSQDDPAVFADVAKVVGALDLPVRDQLERVEAPSKYELKLYFAGGKEVYWGSAEQTHDKARATATVLQREGQRWNVSAPGMVTLIP
ncbi:cell division protein FtsQ/DivIB [Corynebacterium sp. H130]|uniref:cell division protein FtsQ/DivIB n=1 Tax=Corynebacterium sp. H130 TaxID=3133444 RepID=UPI00309C8DBB